MINKKVHLSLLIPAFTALPCMIGCQAFDAKTMGGKINPGNPDYRRVPLGECGEAKLKAAYYKPDCTDPNKFGTNDSIRVSIRNAYLSRTSESNGLSEVAVLANVTVGNPISATEPLTSSRVVHYEEGVRNSEFLRFRDSAILFGPIAYNGGDLHLRLSVMELDEKDNARNTQVLKTLAGIGSSAYPPSAPVLGVLEKIGATILENNADDIDFDFRFSLSAWPKGGSTPNYISNWIAPGYFVVIATEDKNDQSKAKPNPQRLSDDDWNKLRLDIDSGELVWADGVPGRSGRYTNGSYIVVLVESGFDSTEQDALETLANLQASIDAGIKSGAARRTELINELENATTKIKTSIQGTDESTNTPPNYTPSK